VVRMSPAELQAVFDEIETILESGTSAAEKVERLEAVMFEPKDVADPGDADVDGEE
jgi:hypothetical protein